MGRVGILPCVLKDEKYLEALQSDVGMCRFTTTHQCAHMFCPKSDFNCVPPTLENVFTLCYVLPNY